MIENSKEIRELKEALHAERDIRIRSGMMGSRACSRATRQGPDLVLQT